MKIKPVKLGKKMKLQYIPFSQLVNPWQLTKGNAPYYREEMKSAYTIPQCNSRPLKTIKSTDLRALMLSIKQFGLLNPLFVCEIPKDAPKNLDGKYVIIDGQRRYFAIQKLFDLREQWEIRMEAEQKARTGIITLGPHGPIVTSLQEEQDKLKNFMQEHAIENYILIPCIVFDYKTLGECVRHSVEDNKFSVRPSSEYLEIAERQGECLPKIKRENINNYFDSKNKIYEKIRELEEKVNKAEWENERKREIEELEAKLKDLKDMVMTKND